MKKHIITLLGLQGLWVDSWEIEKKQITVFVRSPRTSRRCPGCGKSSKLVHQYHKRVIKHSIWQEKHVVLRVTRRRFKCKICCKPFTEPLPGISRKRSTENFQQIIRKEMARGSFSQSAEKLKISYSSLYGVLKDEAPAERIDWGGQKGRFVLGIDEHSFRGRRMALTLTNITHRRLLGIGRDDRINTLEELLKSAPASQIKEVCIDMKTSYRNVAQRLLPEAKVTADKFHVIAAANRMVDEVRRVVAPKRHFRLLLWKGRERLKETEQGKLKALFAEFKPFPSLYESWFIKEQVRQMYKSKTRQTAEKRLADIIMFCECSRSRYIRDYGRTLKRWQEPILNYWLNHSTNAFTEGVHTRIKYIKRMSYGFRNMENYIAKIMLAFTPFLYLNQHTY